MSHTAMIYHQIQDISLWANSTLNNILVIGNNLYSSITCSVQTNDYLLITDVPDMVSISILIKCIHYNIHPFNKSNICRFPLMTSNSCF